MGQTGIIQQGPKLRYVRVISPVIIVKHGTHPAGAVDQHSGRQPFDAIIATHDKVGIQQHGHYETLGDSHFPGESPGTRHVTVDADRQSDQSGGTIAFLQGIELCELRHTTAAAAAPERDHHDLSAVFRQAPIAPLNRWQREIRRRCADNRISRRAGRHWPDGQHQEHDKPSADSHWRLQLTQIVFD